MSTSYSKCLKTFRTMLRCNQETFAKLIDCSVSWVYHLESGRVYPSNEIFDRINKTTDILKIVITGVNEYTLVTTCGGVTKDGQPDFRSCLRDAIGQKNWIDVSIRVGSKLSPSFHHSRVGNLSNFWVSDILNDTVASIPHSVMQAIVEELECEFVYMNGVGWKYRTVPLSDVGYWIEVEV